MTTRCEEVVAQKQSSDDEWQNQLEDKMARPRIRRLITCEITATYFKPQGIPMRELEEIALDMDEMEAIRLADIEDLYHADAAARMGVSRPTFGNILASAHKKIALALLGGKALRISTNNPDHE